MAAFAVGLARRTTSSPASTSSSSSPLASKAGVEQVDGGQDRVAGAALRHADASGSYRRKMSVALCPPKPKELLIATFTSARRAWFGT